MAPEQIQGKPRPASDQYALGIVVYEWLTGARPFKGTAVEIAMQHSMTPPPPLRDQVAALSTDVEQVVLTTLAKEPKHRFASVTAFARALEQASEYPDRLRGEQIPLEARIIGVAEAYEAMLANRPYQAARSPVDALVEIECCAGFQFDPTVVQALSSLLTRQREETGTREMSRTL